MARPDRETLPRPFADSLGREERLEDVLANRVREPWSVVADGHKHVAPID